MIDDDRPLRSAILQALKKQDYNLMEAGSPEKAASIWAEHHDEIDLILMDVLLPGLSGPEFATEILEQAPKAPIIFMTGVGEQNLPKFHIPEGSRVLLKPFAVSELRELVSSVLAKTETVPQG